MTVYTPNQVYQTINDTYRKHNGKDIPVHQGVVYTGIVLKESGGDANALNPNDSGSRSRGWWQIREVNHPTVTDAMAFDPIQSTEYAYKISDGFSLNGVDPWLGPGRESIGEEFGTNANRFNALWKAMGAAVAFGALEGTQDEINQLYKNLGVPQQLQPNDWSGFDDSQDFGPLDVPGKIGDAVEAGADAVTSGVNAVGDLIGIITDPQFWKRIGIGALGVVIVLIAVALYLGNQAQGAIRSE